MTRLTPAQRLRDLYGIAFPDDFFRFCEFLDRLPRDLLSEACDMRPGHPFAVAAGRRPREYPTHPLWEDRYYHDLPEFVTLFNGTMDGLHWGYFFDAPGERPPVVVHYWHSDTFEHGLDGDTIFEAVRAQVERSEEDFQDMADDPEEADDYQEELEQLAVIRDKLARFWGADRPETGGDYLDTYGGSAWRKPVAQTWSQLGVVVPRRQYRRLSADPFRGYQVNLKKRVIRALVKEAMQVLGEGYPGAALKLGHDLWVWTQEFPECYTLLDAAYSALGREPLRQLLAEARAYRDWCDKPPHRRTTS
jgi:hypothetical protein